MLLGLALLPLAGCGTPPLPDLGDLNRLLEVSGEGEWDEVMDQAEAAWALREDRAQTERALALWQQAAVAETPRRMERAEALAETHGRLAQGFFWLAQGHVRATDDERAVRDELQSLHQEGRQHALWSLALGNPAWYAAISEGMNMDTSTAHWGEDDAFAGFWYGLHTARWSQLDGMVTALRLKDEVFAVMNRVGDLDPEMAWGGVHRYFGAFHARMPVGNPDLEASRAHLSRAVERWPEYLENHLVFAEEYARRAGDDALRARLLNAVRQADLNALPEAIRPENASAVRRAQAIWADLPPVTRRLAEVPAGEGSGSSEAPTQTEADTDAAPAPQEEDSHE
jgi:hypothetical protein